MSEPIAYFLTWTTYGTWLHGDRRGWVESGVPGIQAPDDLRCLESRLRMTADPIILTSEQRRIVEDTIREHCRIRNWELHALNARSNHVHVVLSANVPPEEALRQLKAWCSRRLTEHLLGAKAARSKNGQKRWWTEHGSTKWINDEEYLHNSIHYVLEGQ